MLPVGLELLLLGVKGTARKQKQPFAIRHLTDNTAKLRVSLTTLLCNLAAPCRCWGGGALSSAPLDLFVRLAAHLPARALEFLCITEFDHRASLLLQSFVMLRQLP